jgi:anti-sigma regulatory factor (Ser/Thr protein kinase)
MKTTKKSFRPRARLLLLLGDQLIRDPGVAVFELVKNAYDADSSDANITMSYMDDPSRGQIVVEDSGTGMDLETVTNVWLEPGTDHRLTQKEEKRPTAKYNRVPVGEKGVGRFAAHKLGEKISLITRKARSLEVVVDIDWENDFKGKRYLEDVEIRVTQRTPKHFKGTKTGTRIEVTRLRDTWTRKMVRDLARSINAISSPYQHVADFKAKLILKNHPEWLYGLLDVKDVLAFSLYKAKGIIKGSRLTYSYEFAPYPGMKRVERRTVQKTVSLGSAKNVINLDEHNIGPVQITLYLFDLDSQVLKLGEVNDKKGLKEFLKESGGVRVYRGGIRVYDYGEAGNDWLNLGGRRVNIPTKRLSNNQILGAVALDPKQSINLKLNRGLIEKTNREGFVENADYDCFHDAIVDAITNIEVERNYDKKRIRDAYYEGSQREPVVADISELRQIVEKKHLTSEIGFYLDRIEDDFIAIKDRLLTSASAGLSLSVVIHEVEKGVAELVHAVDTDKATNRIKALAKHLADLIEGYGALVRRSGSAKERASSLVSQALFNLELRLKIHKIDVVRPKAQQYDFQAKCSRRLVISTLMNLIDNSIWWLDNKWGEQAGRKKLFVSIVPDLEGHFGIIVADNGPGFIDPPELLIEPFISRKPEGMGLGLHVASEVMKAQGGALVFPDKDEVSVPNDVDGAIVGLSFKEHQ